MARFSDPSNADSASTDRFYVWDESTDQYVRSELAKNWDRVDGIVGRPIGDTEAWPPSQGIGGGIWKEINLLQQERRNIGELFMWWYPFTGIETLAEVEAQIPSGCVIADGRKVLAADHDFGGGAEGEDIYVPDLRNKYILGGTIIDVTTSNATYVAPGTPGPTVTSNTETIAEADASTGAPGITRMTTPAVTGADGVIRGTEVGSTGSNVKSDASVTIPDHFHKHEHVHVENKTGNINTGGVTNGSTTSLGVANVTSLQTQMRDVWQAIWEMTNAGPLSATTWATINTTRTNATARRAGLIVAVAGQTASYSHTHQDGQSVSSEPKGMANASEGYPISGSSVANSPKYQTSLQYVADKTGPSVSGQQASEYPQSNQGAGNSNGSALGSTLVIDKRPKSFSPLILIKVKHVDTAA